MGTAKWATISSVFTFIFPLNPTGMTGIFERQMPMQFGSSHLAGLALLRRRLCLWRFLDRKILRILDLT
jgi:hypothetical protein